MGESGRGERERRREEGVVGTLSGKALLFVMA